MCYAITASLLLMSLWAAGAQATCVPNPVGELDLSMDGVLSWSPSENCDGVEYKVVIVSVSLGWVMYEFLLSSLSFDLNFLPYCRLYNFSVVPVASNVLGAENYLYGSFALPADTDIGIEDVRAVQIEDDVLVDWKVDTLYASCVRYYQLLIHDEEAEVPESQLVSLPGFLFQNAARCANYKFEVKSYYYNMIGTEKVIDYLVPGATNVPSLVQVAQDATAINTTWSLAKYQRNRCEVTALSSTVPASTLPTP
ncbi:hypothetical protein NQ315_001394 [Exocentrus adspersus]|uniref:Fibronectin type-III domain-containing protein n=1 Tax=Exocentrus adspersus TaxID=1586481 RepID=A0AAV8WF58_9CUCU|nr:hypothetical protein NQ315_001394 [Exocentrus adspersus]